MRSIFQFLGDRNRLFNFINKHDPKKQEDLFYKYDF